MKIYIVNTSYYELGEDAPLNEETMYFLNKANAEKSFNNINPPDYTMETIRNLSACTLKIYKTHDRMCSLWVQMYEVETED